jgi:hypothetical protein
MVYQYTTLSFFIRQLINKIINVNCLTDLSALSMTLKIPENIALQST